jgi:hypothetical protein
MPRINFFDQFAHVEPKATPAPVPEDEINGHAAPGDDSDIDAQDARDKAEARAEGIYPEPPPGIDDPGYQAAQDAAAPKPKRRPAAESLNGFDLTEDGIALAFTKEHQDHLRYDHSIGKWFQWTGKA